MVDLKDMFGGGARGDTFLGLPQGDLAALVADVVLIGADYATPYASVGAYCAGGPAAIRAGAAAYSGDPTRMNFDLGGPILPQDARVVDAGDLPLDPGDPAGNRQRIADAVGAISAAGAVPILLGGDDSVPIPMLAALGAGGPLSILQIDAHIDWRDEVEGERLGLSSTMRRASEMTHVERIVQVGARGVGSADQVTAEAARAWGASIFPAMELDRGGLDAAVDAIPEGARVALCLDLDALDPAIMPSVIAPTAGGLSYRETLSLIARVAARARIDALAVVEFMPSADRNGIGARTAAQLLISVIGLIARQAGSRR